MVTSCIVLVVILLVVRGKIGVRVFVVFAEVNVEKYPVPVSIGGEAGTGEAVVELVFGKPGRTKSVVVAAVVAIASAVVVLVLVPESTEVLVLGTVVLSETLEVSETRTGPGLEAVGVFVMSSL